MKRSKPKSIAFRHAKTKVEKMVKTSVKIRPDQHEFLIRKNINVSSLVRDLLDREIENMGGSNDAA